MSDLEERCHIDKGTYTDGPVLTADVRALFDRIAELEAENAKLRETLQWIASMDVEAWSVDTVQDVVDMAKDA